MLTDAPPAVVVTATVTEFIGVWTASGRVDTVAPVPVKVPIEVPLSDTVPVAEVPAMRLTATCAARRSRPVVNVEVPVPAMVPVPMGAPVLNTTDPVRSLFIARKSAFLSSLICFAALVRGFLAT